MFSAEETPLFITASLFSLARWEKYPIAAIAAEIANKGANIETKDFNAPAAPESPFEAAWDPCPIAFPACWPALPAFSASLATSLYAVPTERIVSEEFLLGPKLLAFGIAFLTGLVSPGCGNDIDDCGPAGCVPGKGIILPFFWLCCPAVDVEDFCCSVVEVGDDCCPVTTVGDDCFSLDFTDVFEDFLLLSSIPVASIFVALYAAVSPAPKRPNVFRLAAALTSIGRENAKFITVWRSFSPVFKSDFAHKLPRDWKLAQAIPNWPIAEVAWTTFEIVFWRTKLSCSAWLIFCTELKRARASRYFCWAESYPPDAYCFRVPFSFKSLTAWFAFSKVGRIPSKKFWIWVKSVGLKLLISLNWSWEKIPER